MSPKSGLLLKEAQRSGALTMKSNSPIRTARFAFVLGSLLVGLGLWAPLALAANYTVNTLNDNTTSGDSLCTLREAIDAANNAGNGDCGANSSGDDMITFSVSETISLQSTLPNIVDASTAGKLTIDGTGQSITISGNNSVRVFEVNSGGDLTLQNLTVSNGRASGSGGGIVNNGTVNITNSTFSGNSASSGGGGIYNGGTVNITNSTFSGNSAIYGGGILNVFGTANITNSTLAGNSSTGFGGGIYNSGTVNITNSTLAGNSAPSGGGIASTIGTLTLKNTIIANSTSGGDCVNSGTVSPSTNNLIEDSTNACGLTNGVNGNIIGSDPNLGSLTGSPAYFPLNLNSLAIDAGDNATCAAAPVNNQSQNGVTRPQGPKCDAGAYEAKPFTLTVTKLGSGTGTVTSTPAAIDCGSDCSESYFHSLVVLVTLTATADAGSYFMSWSDCDFTAGNQCVVNIFNSDKSVTAHFATDNTPPTVNVTGVVNGGQYNVGSVPTPGCNTSDSESGVATPATVAVSNPPADGLGAHTATCTGATDNAGNTQAAPVSVTYSVVTTTTCINISVQATSTRTTFSPRANRADTNTLRIRVRNSGETAITVNQILLDPGKFPTPPYTLTRIRPVLPHTIEPRKSRTFSVTVRKDAGTGREQVNGPFVQVQMSCGVLSASKFIAWLPTEISWLDEIEQSQTIDLQIFDLKGRKILEQNAFEKSLYALSQTLPNGVYLSVLKIRGSDGKVIQTEVKKIAIRR
jgi:CSLREA domain-containing protein